MGQLATGGGDVDVYSIDLVAGDNLTVLTSPFDGAPTNSVDTVIGLFNAAGTTVVSDDDEGLGLLSNFTTIITPPGTYYIAVSGFGDLADPGETFGTAGNFDGSHTAEGNYILTVSIVPIPEPTTGVFAALGGLALLGRRRRR